MPTYIIEREIPGASKLTDEELRGITTKSNDTVAELRRPYTWRHSYVAGDKIYCIHDAENADVVLGHARGGGFPANLVAEVTAVFNSIGPRQMHVRRTDGQLDRDRSPTSERSLRAARTIQNGTARARCPASADQGELPGA